MIQYDYHIHTKYSLDSDADIKSILETAISKGLKEICITDHIDNANNVLYHIPDYNSYFKELEDLKYVYENKIVVKFGGELSLTPYNKVILEKIATDYEFDFIIGSSHETEESLLMPNTTYYEDKTKKQAYTKYFKEVLENANNLDCFDVYGHIDYISRYAHYENTFLAYSDYSEIIDEILKTLISKNKGLEINASGFRYGLNIFHPSLDILKRYKSFGGEILTVGSDAHDPFYIASEFHRAYDFVKEAGFEYLTTFDKRKPSFVKI